MTIYLSVGPLTAQAKYLNEVQAELHRTWNEREESEVARNAWLRCTELLPIANEAFYKPIDKVISEIRHGNLALIDDAITFLEVDPYCYRSGYAKERMIDALLGRNFTTAQRNRLTNVFIHIVNVGDRREFGRYCKLARRVGTAALRTQLKALLRSDDFGIVRRSASMLTSLRHPKLDEADIAIVRSVVLNNAEIENVDTTRRTRRFALKVWAPEWEQDLISNALGHAGKVSRASIMVLACLPRLHATEDQRRALSALVIKAVERGGDEEWFEGLARNIGTDELATQLVELMDNEDQEIARRARWAAQQIV